MQYPKPIMRLTELRDIIGFPEAMLMTAYHYPGQTFASKANPIKRNSPIVFDTEGFEKWRVRQVTAQKRK